MKDFSSEPQEAKEQKRIEQNEPLSQQGISAMQGEDTENISSSFSDSGEEIREKPDNPAESRTETSQRDKLEQEISVNSEKEVEAIKSEVNDPEIFHPDNEIQTNETEPNSIYERNGYEYKTDELGRTREVYGTLNLEKGNRSSLQTEVGHMGLENDEGGHLIGTRFDGPTDAFNLVPQNANLNRGEWKTMENSWANDVADNKDVKVMLEPVFRDDSTRPKSFDVITQVDGELTYKSFLNQASDVPSEET